MIGIPRLAEMQEAVSTAFKGTWAQMTDIFLQEHDEDGKHADVTAHSLTVTANAATSATGAGSFDGNVTADADGNPVVVGVLAASGSIRPITGVDMTTKVSGTAVSHWRLGTFASASNLRELLLQDILAGLGSPYTARIKWNGASYIFHPEAASAIQLGGNASGERWEEVNANTIRALLGYYERGRTTAAGEMVSVAYTAGDFTASAGTWTVAAGDLFAFSYTLVGKLMTVFFEIANTDVSAAPVTLSIKIPGGFTSAAFQTRNTFAGLDASVAMVGAAFVGPSSTTIDLYRDASSTPWTSTTGGQAALGQVSFFIA